MTIGDGCSASVWYDNWSSIGALHSIVTNRDIYEARMSTDMVIKDAINNGKWGWPDDWYDKYPDLSQVHVIRLDNNASDSLQWKTRNGIMGDFSVKHAYNDLLNIDHNVIWSKLVWFSQNIPKHAFILWVAIHNRLMTQDRLRKWGTYDMMVCYLCYEAMDSHLHLFFECKYAKQFWGKVCLKLDVSWEDMNWNDIVRSCATMKNGNTINSIIRRLSLAASVYLIWSERNARMFRDEKRNVDKLYDAFLDTVRIRLAGLKVKPSTAVMKVQDEWSVKMITMDTNSS